MGGAGITVASSSLGMTAQSYRRIIGANERIHVAIAGLGRRLGAYIDPIASKDSNVELVYLCDVMESQRQKAMENFFQSI